MTYTLTTEQRQQLRAHSENALALLEGQGMMGFSKAKGLGQALALLDGLTATPTDGGTR